MVRSLCESSLALDRGLDPVRLFRSQFLFWCNRTPTRLTACLSKPRVVRGKVKGIDMYGHQLTRQIESEFDLLVRLGEEHQLHFPSLLTYVRSQASDFRWNVLYADGLVSTASSNGREQARGSSVLLEVRFSGKRLLARGHAVNEDPLIEAKEATLRALAEVILLHFPVPDEWNE